MIRMPGWMSDRRLMYLIVGLEMLILSSIVGSQELNRALDSEPAVDLEVVQARARKDPFRGAFVSGESALDLDGREATLPAEGLQPGDKVLVFFAVEPDRRPRITRVQRGRRGAPSFSPTSFTIPGTVRERGDGPFATSGSGLIARVGHAPILIQLELPASIPVDDSAVGELSGPSLVRARLHRGFLEHRYLDDVRLIGRGWTHEVSFLYDPARERLVVFAPRDISYRDPTSDHKPHTDVFSFDALGKEVGATAVVGRVVEGIVEPGEGHLLALVSDQRWGHQEVALTRIRENGQVVQRSTLIAFDRILGFDSATGSVWTLVGLASRRSAGPHFIERTTFAGAQGPRLGPFASVPRRVLSHGGDVWVVEPEQHRLTRLDLASGRTLHEFRDLNGPTDIAVDAGSVYVVEANGTQLTRLSDDGRVLWRVPRFQGLAWVLSEPGAGAWVGASTFDGRAAGVMKLGPDGSIAPVAARMKDVRAERRRPRLGASAVLSARDGRLYLLENHAINILSVEGKLLKRVDGYRFPKEQRVRG